MSDIYQEALALHHHYKGKISIESKVTVEDTRVLSLVYSPGVAAPCLDIQKNPLSVYDYTMKGNTVAVITDGTAVLGLGDIGPEAALPVMEGKAMLFKIFAGIDAFPICLATQDTEEIIKTIRNIAPGLGGINLEDIAAPRSFEIEERLQDLGIPVFHDDQHGTAIVVLAGLISAAKVVGKDINQLRIVVNGAGAAGISIAKLLKGVGQKNPAICVKEIILCDTNGIIHSGRTDLNDAKLAALKYSNSGHLSGGLKDAIKDADVFVGVSKGNLLTAEDIRTMAERSIVFALANPTPEIFPDEAISGGAMVVATGRGDFKNQVNNVLGFPGIFRGALDARAKTITPEMKMAAALAIAECVPSPTADYIIPASLNKEVAQKVAEAVYKAALDSHVG